MSATIKAISSVAFDAGNGNEAGQPPEDVMAAWDTLGIKGVLIVKRDDIAFTQSRCVVAASSFIVILTVQRVNRKRGSGPSL